MRLVRVAKVIAMCREPLIWSHIGSGPELHGLKKLVKDLPSHIEVRFMGDMSHEKVMEIYQKQAFHMLISRTESEGLNVSMMEAIYYGKEDYFDDKAGHVLLQNQALAICDKTAGSLAALEREYIFIYESTLFYDGGGCC